MRSITKGPEPRTLVKHRASSFAHFDNYTHKDELRAALVREQRGLCCYCTTQIYESEASTKIEHWRSRSHYPADELSYSNLLAACLGGRGQPASLQHCDTRKGDRDVKFNPASSTHQIERRIVFEPDGTIRSTDPEFDMEINEVLNLNLQDLKNRRKSVLTGILDWWKSEKARLHGPMPRDRLLRERDRRFSGTHTLRPFDPVAVWWIEQKLGILGP